MTSKKRTKQTDKSEIDTKQNKVIRISTALANMNQGEIITPTRLFRSIGIHPNTGKDLLDLYESLTEIGFEILRDKNDEIKGVLKTDESLNVRKDIREIKKDSLEIKNMVDELKSLMENKK